MLGVDHTALGIECTVLVVDHTALGVDHTALGIDRTVLCVDLMKAFSSSCELHFSMGFSLITHPFCKVSRMILYLCGFLDEMIISLLISQSSRYTERKNTGIST